LEGSTVGRALREEADQYEAEVDGELAAARVVEEVGGVVEEPTPEDGAMEDLVEDLQVPGVAVETVML